MVAIAKGLITIQNVIATADLLQSVEARKFTNYLWGKYNRELYGGRCGYVKDKTMRGSVTVFFTGKMISTGAKSTNEAVKQLHHAVELLSKSGLIHSVKISPKIQNIVSTLDLLNRIDVGTLALSLSKSVYEPEIFPGVIFRTDKGPTCLIFSTGKVVIAGAKSESEIRQIATDLSKTISDFVI